jgi:DUF4097 and DUF4098 domain-containing protein YvlB
MKKALSIILAIGLILLLVGGIIFVITMSALGWDFNKISGISSADQTYTEAEATKNLVIKFESTDIDVVFDETAEKISITYPQKTLKNGNKYNEITIVEKDGTLQISEKVYWYRAWLLFNFNNSKVTVRIPASRALDFSVKSDNGNICFFETGSFNSLKAETNNGNITTKPGAKISAGSTKMYTDNGDVKITNFNALSLELETDNGEIYLSDVEIAEKFTATTSNGDIELRGKLSAQKVDIETDNGEVEAKSGLIDAKEIILSTDNGDIEATLAGKKEDYSVSIDKNHTSDSNISNNATGVRRLEIEVDNGDIEIYFTA